MNSELTCTTCILYNMCIFLYMCPSAPPRLHVSTQRVDQPYQYLVQVPGVRVVCGRSIVTFFLRLEIYLRKENGWMKAKHSPHLASHSCSSVSPSPRGDFPHLGHISIINLSYVAGKKTKTDHGTKEITFQLQCLQSCSNQM